MPYLVSLCNLYRKTEQPGCFFWGGGGLEQHLPKMFCGILLWSTQPLSFKWAHVHYNSVNTKIPDVYKIACQQAP